MKRSLYKLSLLLVPPLFRVISSLLFATCRVSEYGREAFDECHKNGSLIAALWHYCVFCCLSSIEGKNWVAMVSGSKDAEYVSLFLNQIGVQTVRGSRGKGGLRAIRDIVALLKKEQKQIAIIADGSQGPARKAQVGAILMASKTGIPIFPIAMALERYKAFNSWDCTIIPMPFSRMVVYYGEPFYVPAKIKAAEMEASRQDLEKRLNITYQRAWNCFDKERHDDK